ncbi:MAG TPA: PIN domain-containing protein [Acidiferrobacterales bacterium]|nr:PIN domain-containing protein [Acidiferrobacterales bacterium]
MTPFFLDTGFLIALEAGDDQHHAEAVAFWERYQESPASLVTTFYVFNEVVTFFNSRGHHTKAVEIGRYLLSSPSVHFVYVDEPLFEETWQLFQRYRDKRYSFTDCVSFTVMKRLKLKTALTFDKHFTQAGFERKP